MCWVAQSRVIGAVRLMSWVCCQLESFLGLVGWSDWEMVLGAQLYMGSGAEPWLGTLVAPWT